MRQSEIRASTVVRGVFGTATIGSLVIAVLIGDPRWYAVSAACGLVWWAWDLLLEHCFVPLGDWFMGVVTGGVTDPRASQTRLTLDDTIRLLENHLKHHTAPKVDINAAIRLEEIYRTVKKDPEGARRVIETVLERYPEAPELERFRRDGEGR
jgi:hypothetical protein